MRRCWLSLLVFLLVACSAGGTPPAARFTLSVVPTEVSLPQGSSILLGVTLGREAGFTGEVNVALESPPEGISSNTLVFTDVLTDLLFELSTTAAAKVGSTFNLTVAGSSGGAKTTAALTVTVAAPVPSSQELIQQALVAGTIDYGTSLLYRAYALFGDASLPESYRGSGSEEEDGGFFVEAQDAYGELSAEVRAKLEPFLVRPTDPKSMFNASRPASARDLTAQNDPQSCGSLPALSWVTKESTTTPIRVWVQCTPSVEQNRIPPARYLDLTLAAIEKAYGPMTRLMGEPILDGGTPNEGGDPNIDIYLSPYVVRSGRETIVWGGAGAHTVYAAPFRGNKSSAFIQLPEWRVFTSDFRPFLLHEFFHVLQAAHNFRISFRGGNEWWFTEASATWGSIYFDRTLWARERSTGQELQRFVYNFQNKLESLTVSSPSLHMYAAYIWPFFVEQETDGPEFMGATWQRLEAATTFEQGNNVIDGVVDFKDNFHNFAVRNLNYPTFFGNVFSSRARYTTLDSLFPERFMPSYRRDIQVLSPLQFKGGKGVPVKLPSLSADYLRFLIDTTKVRKVTFDFSSALDRNTLDVDALIKYKQGGWKLQTVTQDELTLCMDKPEEEADDVWLVLSNHAKAATSTLEGELIVETFGTCDDTWTGTSTSIIADYAPTYEIRAQATWNWEEAQQRYVPEGTVSFKAISGNCTITPSSYPITPENGGDLRLDYSTDPPSYEGVGTTLWSATYTCPDIGGSFTAGAGGTWFQARGTLSNGGKTIGGTQSNSGQTFTFNFTKD